MQQSFNFDIIVNIPDLQLGDSVLKRKATFETLVYNKKSASLAVSWLIEYYQNDNGAYGAKIDAKGINSYSKELIAGSSSLVNLANQELFYPTDLQKDEQGVVTDTRVYTTEFEFYNYVAETQQVNIHQLIRASAAKIV